MSKKSPCTLYLPLAGLLLFGCGELPNLGGPAGGEDDVDTLHSSIVSLPPTTIHNTNWISSDSKAGFVQTPGTVWNYYQSKYGTSCDCTSDAYYSFFSGTLSRSEQDSIYFTGFPGTAVRKHDSFPVAPHAERERLDTSLLLRFDPLLPLPSTAYPMIPVLVDDSGRRVLFYKHTGWDRDYYRVYIEPYGLIYSRSHESCGTFCGYSYTTVLSRFNGKPFDYLAAIGVAKGLFAKWVQHMKTIPFTLLLENTAVTRGVYVNGVQIWSPGDPDVVEVSQPESTGVEMKVFAQSETSAFSATYFHSPIDSIIVPVLTNQTRVVFRRIDTDFFPRY